MSAFNRFATMNRPGDKLKAELAKRGFYKHLESATTPKPKGTPTQPKRTKT